MSTVPSDHVGSKMLFENERVRVWELAVAPGESLEKHLHKLDYVYIVTSGGLVQFEDPDNPSEARDVQFEDGKVAFVSVPEEGRIDQTLTNIGSKPHKNYVIELKEPKP